MDFRAGYSKPYHFTMLLVLLGMLGLLGRFHRVMPLGFAVPCAVLVTAGAVALVAALISSGAVVEITSEGVVYQPRRYPVILWADILEVTLLPRVSRDAEGVHTHLREQWRPVVLKVRGRAKYEGRMRKFLRVGVGGGADGLKEEDDWMRIEIPFMGLDGDAREFYRQVKSRQPGAVRDARG